MRYLVATILIFLLFYSCNPITERMPDYEVHGIDVSHYQSTIQWDSIAAQNITFAFVKATEGEEFADSMYCNNWLEMKRVGIKRGAYHFFRPTLSVLKQAKNFISNVTLEAGDLPPVLDVEVDDGASDALAVLRIRTWLEMIEMHYHIKPVIYTNLSYYNKYIAGNLDDYPIWIARYSSQEPLLPQKKEWLFWQYGNRGQLKGIDGHVDFNVFNGSHSQLESFCVSSNPLYSSLPITGF